MLDDLKCCEACKILKEEAQDRRERQGGSLVPVNRQFHCRVRCTIFYFQIRIMMISSRRNGSDLIGIILKGEDEDDDDEEEEKYQSTYTD